MMHHIRSLGQLVGQDGRRRHKWLKFLYLAPMILLMEVPAQSRITAVMSWGHPDQQLTGKVLAIILLGTLWLIGVAQVVSWVAVCSVRGVNGAGMLEPGTSQTVMAKIGLQAFAIPSAAMVGAPLAWFWPWTLFVTVPLLLPVTWLGLQQFQPRLESVIRGRSARRSTGGENVDHESLPAQLTEPLL